MIIRITTCVTMAVIACCCALRAQSPAWALAIQGGGANSQSGKKIVPDASGGFFVLGTFVRAATFGEKTLTGRGLFDLFLARYSSNGQCLWVHGIGSSEMDAAGGMAVDAAGDVYISGSFTGSLMLPHESGSDMTLEGEGGRDFFVAKYTSDGAFAWGLAAGGSGDDEASGLAVDGGRNVYLAGGFSATMTIGEGSVTSMGSTDAFVAKLSPIGELLWMQRGGGSGQDEATSAALDATGNLYVAGTFTSNGSFGGSSVETTSGVGFFLARYDAAGTVAWAKGDGGSPLTFPIEIAVDGPGNIYAASAFRGQLKVGSKSMTSQGEDDMFVAGYDRDGGFRWANHMKGYVIQYASGIAVDGGGNVYVTGYSQELNDGSVFAIKYTPGGTQAWMKADTRRGLEFGGGSYSGGIGVDAQGNVYITGEFSGQMAFGNTILTATGSSPSGTNGSDIYIAKLGTTASVRSGAAGGAILLGSAPNPCTDRATLRFRLAVRADVRVTLSDMQGRIVRPAAQGIFEQGEHTIGVATDDLPQGAYLIQLRAGDAILTERLDVIR